MNSKNLNLKIDIKDIEPVKDLLRLLGEHFQDLPPELMVAVSRLTDRGAVVVDYEDNHVR